MDGKLTWKQILKFLLIVVVASILVGCSSKEPRDTGKKYTVNFQVKTGNLAGVVAVDSIEVPIWRSREKGKYIPEEYLALIDEKLLEYKHRADIANKNLNSIEIEGGYINNVVTIDKIVGVNKAKEIDVEYDTNEVIYEFFFGGAGQELGSGKFITEIGVPKKEDDVFVKIICMDGVSYMNFIVPRQLLLEAAVAPFTDEIPKEITLPTAQFTPQKEESNRELFAEKALEELVGGNSTLVGSLVLEPTTYEDFVARDQVIKAASSIVNTLAAYSNKNVKILYSSFDYEKEVVLKYIEVDEEIEKSIRFVILGLQEDIRSRSNMSETTEVREYQVFKIDIYMD